MSIAEECQKLSELADHYRNVVMIEDEVGRLNALADDLEDAATSLAGATGPLAVMTQAHLITVSSELVADAVAADNLLSAAQRAFDPPPDSEPRADGPEFHNGISRAKQLAHDLIVTNRRGWAEAKERLLDQSSEQLLAVLVKLPPWQHLAVDLRSVEADFVQVRNATAATPGSVDAFVRAVDGLSALKQKIEEVGGDDPPPEGVVAFLSAAGDEQGAPLSLLTPHVSAWLERYDVAANLRIVVVGR